MFTASTFIIWILPSIILLSGLIDDLRSRKIHNYLIIFLIILSLATLIFIRGLDSLLPAFAGALLAFALGFPLFLLRVIGGGDIKLYIVLGLVLPSRHLIFTFLFSFLWAGLLGLIKALLDRKIKTLFLNLLSLLKWKLPSADQVTTFPFSVSLFFAWLTAFYF